MEKPQNRAAFIPAQGKPLEVRDTTYPKPGGNEIVIKNSAVAINPIDWKQQEYGIFIKEYPSVFGVDVAGIVEEVGTGVTAFAPGDRVIAYVKRLCDPDVADSREAIHQVSRSAIINTARSNSTS